MARFLVDEDLPRSLAGSLRAAGMDAVDVRDVGLRGEPDEAIAEQARRSGSTVITADVAFASDLANGALDQAGAVLVRLPGDLSGPEIVTTIVRSLVDLGVESLTDTIVVVEPGRIRVRRTRRP